MQRNFRTPTILILLVLTLTLLAAPTSAQSDELPAPQTDHTVVNLTVLPDDLAVDFQRLDFWSQLPDGTQPRNGLFVAFLGQMTGYADNSCLHNADFGLEIDGQSYELSNRMGRAKRAYGSDYPGGFMGQCVDDGETESTFILFDIPQDADGQAKLIVNGQTATLAVTLPELLADSTPPATATPRPTSTSTPRPAATSQAESPVAIDGTPALVTNIVDGDTIDVEINGQLDTVRYIGIDTPERGDPGYQAATQANADLVVGQIVYLVQDVTDRDRYDRLLRYVYLSDGTHVNAELVAQGYAQPVEYEPDTSMAAEFRELAQDAAAARLGFWSGGSDVMSYGLTTGGINLREGPGTDFGINRSLPADTPLTIFGRNEDASWVQVRTPDRSGGWLFAGLLALNVPVAEIDLAREIPTLEVAPAVETTRSTEAEAVPQQAEPQQEAAQQAPQQAEAQPEQPVEQPVVPEDIRVETFDLGNVTLFIIENNSTFEILGVRNDSGQDIDIGGWWLDGSKGDDRCSVPNGTVLAPGGIFEIATGDSVVRGQGIKCSGRPIWNNKGETIYLHGPDGQLISIQSVRR